MPEFFKHCWFCDKDLPESHFTESRLNHDQGDVSICRLCDQERAAQNFIKNKDKRLKCMKEYQEVNRDKINQKRRERYKKNKDKGKDLS